MREPRSPGVCRRVGRAVGLRTIRSAIPSHPTRPSVRAPSRPLLCRPSVHLTRTHPPHHSSMYDDKEFEPVSPAEGESPCLLV